MKKQKRILLFGDILGVIVTAVLFLIPLETAFRSFLAWANILFAFFMSDLLLLLPESSLFSVDLSTLEILLLLFRKIPTDWLKSCRASRVRVSCLMASSTASSVSRSIESASSSESPKKVLSILVRYLSLISFSKELAALVVILVPMPFFFMLG